MKTYCTQNNGNCDTCSLVNYNKDCRNNELHTIRDLVLLTGNDTNDILGCPDWMVDICIEHDKIDQLEKQVKHMKSLLRDFANGVYAGQKPETLLNLMGLDD